MVTVLAGARIGERLAGHRGQSECVVEFTVCQKSGVGRDHAAAKLKHQATVEIELKSIQFARLTRQLNSRRARRPQDLAGYRYGNGALSSQFPSYGKNAVARYPG